MNYYLKIIIIIFLYHHIINKYHPFYHYKRKKIKNLDSKLLTRLPVLLAQIKAGYNSCKLKNEIRHILYLLYQHNKITKKLYNNQVIIMGDNELIVTMEPKTFHFNLPIDAGINLKHEIYST